MGRTLFRLSRPLELGLFLELPLMLLGFLVWVYEFTGEPQDLAIFRTAGRAVLDGISPYVAADPSILAENDKFVYPAATAVAFVPFAVLPTAVSSGLFLALSVASVLGALRVLEVRDWRCYGAVFLAYPTLGSVGVGSIGPFLLLVAALAWRYRSQVAGVGVTVALGAVAKLLLWPLFVWLVATRRFRGAALGVAIASAVAAGGWAVIGFAGLREYPSIVGTLSDVMTWKAYSAAALAKSFGAGDTAIYALTAVLTVGGIAAVLLFARLRDGDRRAFTAAIAVALLASPILWSHYLILLFVPIALARPRLSPLWLAPLGFWISPRLESLGEQWRISAVLACAVAVLLATVRAQPPPAPRAATQPV